MYKNTIRGVIFTLLIAVIALAIMAPSSHYYPQIEITADANLGEYKASYIFEGSRSLSDCESIIGNTIRLMNSRCTNCRANNLHCDSTLTPQEHLLFSEDAINFPSARSADSVITFQAVNDEKALLACQTAEKQSAGGITPIKCYPANTVRSKLNKSISPSPWSLTIFLVALGSAWLVGWLIIRYEHLHAHLSHDHVDAGPQKYHTEPTPRIGGLTVMAGLLGAGGVMLFADTISVEGQFGLLLLASVPAFFGGLVEDITKEVGVLKRLLLTMLSGAVAAWLLGAVLNHLDLPGVDTALTWMPAAVIFTVFAVGGITNAINIIDGYNGLAGGFAVIVLAALAIVGYNTGDILIFNTALALSGGILGFLLWNWPSGQIFFGDGGAYLVGFLIAELSVLLVIRNPEVSPWFPLLLLIYPIFETIFSIYRRKFRNNRSPGQPDNQHLHQLIHDKLIPHQANGKHFSRNSKVAKYLWIPTGILAAFGCMFSGSTPLLASAALGFCVFYVVNYRRMLIR